MKLDKDTVTDEELVRLREDFGGGIRVDTRPDGICEDCGAVVERDEAMTVLGLVTLRFCWPCGWLEEVE